MPFMNRKKSWVFIVLFALSINIFHGFFIHHHEHVDSRIHKDIKDTHIVAHDVCDKCQHIHLNFIVDISKSEIPYIEQNKPLFSDNKLLLSVTIPLLLRPPIV